MIKEAIAPLSSAFLNEYANFGGLKSICVTFDVDFAAEYMIQNALDALEQYGGAATFFATHRSEILGRLAREGRHEVGLHPHLGANSTQGNGSEAIIASLKAEYPSAISNRFHKLNYAYADLYTLKKHGLRADVSTLRYNLPYALPAYQPDAGMVLHTYIWEDGICENAGLPMDISGIDLGSPGVKILNFHPMNAYINVKTQGERLAFLAAAGQLTACPEATAQKFRRTGPGSFTVLEQVLKFARENGVKLRTINEVSEAFLGERLG